MVSNYPSAVVDWRPYLATAATLLLAMGLNLWTGNATWLGYSMLGTAIFCIFVGIARLGWFAFPRRTVWLLGMASALHYIGGSFAGLHQFGGPNGLYFVFPWWDNVVHLLGTAAVAVGAATLLEKRLQDAPLLWGFLSACVAIFAGVMVELLEFGQFVVFGTVDQGFYTNTLIDLYNNALGGVLGAAIHIYWARADS